MFEKLVWSDSRGFDSNMTQSKEMETTSKKPESSTMMHEEEE